YLGLGLSSEHAPELIRMSVDHALHQAPGDSPHVWAPVHAWRALGQLRVTSAAGELLEFVDGSDDDWALTDLPHVLSMMGSGILPELTSFFHDSTRGEWARGTVIDAMTQLARAEPDRREGVVASLSLQLSRWYRNEHIL